MHGVPACAGTCTASRATQTLVDDCHDLAVAVAEQLTALRVVAVVAANHCGCQGLCVTDRRTLLGCRAGRGRVGGGAGLRTRVLRPCSGIAIEPVDVDPGTDARHVTRAGILPGGGEWPRADVVGHGSGVAQGLSGISTRISGNPQTVVGVGHCGPVGHFDDTGRRVDERLDAPCGFDTLQPPERPPAPCHVAARWLPVQYWNHTIVDIAARLADKPVSLGLRAVAEIRPSKMVDAATDAVGLERLHCAVGNRISVPVALSDFHESEVDTGCLGGCGLTAADTSLPFAHVHTAVGERGARHEHQSDGRQQCGQHGCPWSAGTGVAWLSAIKYHVFSFQRCFGVSRDCGAHVLLRGAIGADWMSSLRDVPWPLPPSE